MYYEGINHLTLPIDVMMKMKKSDMATLQVLLNIFSVRGLKNPNKPLYITPSEQYIASRTGLRRETVSRAIRRLELLSLIAVINRRRTNGHWSTNLYKLGPMFLRWIRRTADISFFRRNRVTIPSHLDNIGINSNNITVNKVDKGVSLNADLLSIITRCQELAKKRYNEELT